MKSDRALDNDFEQMSKLLHAEEHQSQYLVSTKDVSGVDEGERALLGFLQRLKTCLKQLNHLDTFLIVDISCFQLTLVFMQGADFIRGENPHYSRR